MKSPGIIATALFLLFSAFCIAQKPKVSPNEQFRGMWILDKYESHDTITGKWSTEAGRMGYTGYILFDGLGHMAIQITPADYNEFALNKKSDSLGMKIVMEYYNNNLIYFADYKVEGNTIEHKIVSCTNPESIGAILKRDFEFKGKALYLTPKNRLNGSKIRMKWVKVQ